MHRFIGRFEYSVDTKGRVSLPARFRKGLNSSADATFVLCKAPDNRLRAYPLDVWGEKEKQYAQLPLTAENTIFLRSIYQSIEEVELDAQGRIKIPAHLLSYAQLEGKAVLVGFSSEQCIEICVPQLLVEPNEEEFSAMFYRAMAPGVNNG